ncbi:hypothetical protein [uncultured Flavobacterium sp.]|uniref:hypothetical protein n=1 Tax=uncultured Flavobacterium sp. TaxID=165435 RepID=UPI002594187E|nr:hypothetical protein [uncultured Flavobacterium sp.]
MACDLSLGRLEPCKDSVGGLRAVYFVNHGDATGYTYDVTNTDVITDVAGTPSAYKYELKGASTFTQNLNSSRENGTTFYEQVLELTFKKLTIKDHKELKLMAYGLPQVIVEDNNGNFFYAGLKRGMDVTGGTIVTGGAMGDLSGYTLTLTGQEPVPANFIGDTLAGAGFTVVSGT